MRLIRSLLFNVGFYLNTIGHLLVCMPVLLMPRLAIWKVVHSWAAVNHWLLRTICGTRHEIRHAERIPRGPLLVACKHQSTWEVFVLPVLLRDPTFVLKRELAWLPVFGWYLAKGRMIPVVRGARSAALEAIAKRAAVEIHAGQGRPIVMFPEGTRRAPGAEPAYKYGVVHLYGQLGVPCLPIALNSGLYWPRRSLDIRPGTIVMEILEPIPPGLDKDVFLARLQTAIETATDRLVAEGRRELEARPVVVPKRA